MNQDPNAPQEPQELSRHDPHNWVPRGDGWRMIIWLLSGVAVASLLFRFAELAKPKDGQPPTFTSWFLENSEMTRTHTVWGYQVPSLALILLLVAGAVFLLGLCFRPRKSNAAVLILLIAGLGLLMRVPMFDVPMRGGIDYNRYLWDGAMSAHLKNPYQYSPGQLTDQVQWQKGRVKVQILKGKSWQSPRGNKLKANDATFTTPQAARKAVADGVAKVIDPPAEKVPADILALASSPQGYARLEASNHPDLRTPYPPLTQAVFAAAYMVKPFDVLGLRIVLGVLELLTAVVVLLLIRQAKMNMVAWSAYFWNPVLIVETYYSAHVEILVALCLSLFVLLLVQRRLVGASVALVGAVAAKAWPVILAFFLVRAAWGNKKQLVLVLAVFGILTAAVMVPFTIASSGPGSGPLVYAKHSHENFGMHWVFDRIDSGILKPAGIGKGLQRTTEALPDQNARLIGTLLTFLAAALLGLRRPSQNVQSMAFRVGAVLMLYLLLNHTVYPWYYVGIVPLAAVAMRPSLLAWSFLAILVYWPRVLAYQAILVYWPRALAYQVSGYPDLPLMAIVHGPVWLLLAWDYVRSWKKTDELTVEATGER